MSPRRKPKRSSSDLRRGRRRLMYRAVPGARCTTVRTVVHLAPGTARYINLLRPLLKSLEDLFGFLLGLIRLHTNGPAAPLVFEFSNDLAEVFCFLFTEENGAQKLANQLLQFI